MARSDGFLIVASRDHAFYDAAVRCAESIRDEWPEASICLATHEPWLDDRGRAVADDLIAPIPNHNRAKLWALPRSPYDRTLYVDADCHAVSPRIRDVFGIEADAPWLATRNRAHCSKIVHFDAERKYDEPGPGRHTFEWHCGLFRYDRPRCDAFLHDWLRVLLANRRSGFKYGPRIADWFDTAAFWQCFHEKDYGWTPQAFPAPDGIWNWIGGRYGEAEALDAEGRFRHPIFVHYTIPQAVRENRGDGDMETLL